MVFKNVWSGIRNLFSTELDFREPFSFPRINTLNSVIKDLKIDEFAKMDGEKNLPRTNRKTLDATEEKIKGFYQRLNQDSKGLASEYANNVRQNIDNSKIMLIEAKIDNFNKETTNWFNEKKKEAKNFKYFIDERIAEAVNRYKEFRKKNSLNRRAAYPDSIRLYIATALAAFVGESIINGVFLKEVTTKGLVGGFQIAVLISFFNVWVGYAYGKYVLPHKNHIHNANKYWTRFSMLLYTIYCLIVNLFCAHYREAARLSVDENTEIKLTNVFQNAFTNPFGIDDILSFALLLLGIVFTIAGIASGYNSNDPYPGYGKVQKNSDDTMKKYASEHWKYYEDCTKEKNNKIKEIRMLFQDIRTKYRSVKAMLDIFSTLKERYNIHISKINSECKQAVMHYRAVNIRHRNDREPKYFEKPFTLEDTVNLNIDVDDQEKMVSKLKNTIETISEKQQDIVAHIESSYEDAIKKVKDLRDYHFEVLKG